MTTPWLDDGRMFNAAILLEGGRIAAVRSKHELPNYGVFDEKRVFVPRPLPEVTALSNKFGSMLLTTGNKAEMSVGYATLYGDMCGGYSVLKDLYKTEVYDLAA